MLSEFTRGLGLALAGLILLTAPVTAQIDLMAQPREEAEAEAEEPRTAAEILRRIEARDDVRATPVERRVYASPATNMSNGTQGPRYSCEHNSAGEATSCWCNWNSDANDCKDMILNAPCGENGAWWTSDVEGEYGCDRQD